MGVTVFQGDTVNEVWVKAYNALAAMAENSFRDPSRDGPVVGEICDAVFCVADPTKNIVTSEIRRMPMRYAVNLLFFNLIYILCGVAFAALCAFGLSILQKRATD